MLYEFLSSHYALAKLTRVNFLFIIFWFFFSCEKSPFLKNRETLW